MRLCRVRHQLERTPAAGLAGVLTELEGLIAPGPVAAEIDDIVVPVQVTMSYGEVAFL
jgi:hypothetical protein